MQAPAVDPMTPLPFCIHRVQQETHDTFSLELRPVGGGKEIRFAPGQFNMLYAFGVGEAPISISGDPAKSKVVVHTIRAVGAVTKALKKLRPGAIIGVRGPFGSAWPVQEAVGSDIIFVAGGIGLAPLRGAMYQVLSQREKYGRVMLLYGTRTPADILFKRELQQWRGYFDLEVHVTVDRAAENWRGNVGVVTTLIERAPFDPMDTVAMVCGPEIMMQFTLQELEKREIPLDRIYLSMERNMKCAVAFCGHCQWGSQFVCKDGPVFRYDRIKDLLTRREI